MVKIIVSLKYSDIFWFRQFYKNFIKNSKRIIAPFILILWKISKLLKIGFLALQAEWDEYNQEIRIDTAIVRKNSIGDGNKNLSNLSKARTAKNFIKSKKLINSKNEILLKLKS